MILQLSIYLTAFAIVPAVSLETTTYSSNPKTTTTLYSILSFLPDCKRGTIEIDRNFDYRCKCFDNWEGDLCDIPKCLNGGNYNYVNGTCECSNDWIGRHCDYKECDQYRKWSESQKKCVCKKKGYEGDHCHLPQCSSHGLRVKKGDEWVCKCESALYHGELCDTSKCDKDHGTPYFSKSNVTDVTVNVTDDNGDPIVKCRCEKGWIGETCSKKDCHGHGTSFSKTICICDNINFNILTDCATCSYGYTGENCDQRTRDPYGDSNYQTGNGNSYSSSKNTNYGAIGGVAFVAVLLSIFCAILKHACRSSPQYGTTCHTSAAATITPPYPPSQYRPHSTVDPFTVRSNTRPVSLNLGTGYWNPQDDTSHYGPSAPSVRVPLTVEEPDLYNQSPPPAYSDVRTREDTEPPPPDYEDAVKQTDKRHS